LKENKSCAFKTSIGGQALIEGILMRGPKKQSIVCRTAEGLVEKVEELKVGKDKYPILGWPFIRGLFIFLSSMINGMSALMYSAELVPLEEQEEDKLDKWIKEHFSEEKATKIIIYVAVVLGIALSLFLFIFLPAFIVGIIKPLTANYVVRNLSEGLGCDCVRVIACPTPMSVLDEMAQEFEELDGITWGNIGNSGKVVMNTGVTIPLIEREKAKK
jgi:uncharacterized protein YqhQ